MIFTGCRCRISHRILVGVPFAPIWRMNPKTLQYLMGHSDISVTMNVYTHIGFDKVEKERRQIGEFKKAQDEIEKKNDAKAVLQKMFKAI